MNITNYIKERIEELRPEFYFHDVFKKIAYEDVLSKIEEEEKEKKWRMRDLTK